MHPVNLPSQQSFSRVAVAFGGQKKRIRLPPPTTTWPTFLAYLRQKFDIAGDAGVIKVLDDKDRSVEFDSIEDIEHGDTLLIALADGGDCAPYAETTFASSGRVTVRCGPHRKRVRLPRTNRSWSAFLARIRAKFGLAANTPLRMFDETEPKVEVDSLADLEDNDRLMVFPESDIPPPTVTIVAGSSANTVDVPTMRYGRDEAEAFAHWVDSVKATLGVEAKVHLYSLARRDKHIRSFADVVAGDVLTVFGANPVPNYSLEAIGDTPVKGQKPRQSPAHHRRSAASISDSALEQHPSDSPATQAPAITVSGVEGSSDMDAMFDPSSEEFSDQDDFIAQKEQMQKQLNAMIATTMKP